MPSLWVLNVSYMPVLILMSDPCHYKLQLGSIPSIPTNNQNLQQKLSNLFFLVQHHPNCFRLFYTLTPNPGRSISLNPHCSRRGTSGSSEILSKRPGTRSGAKSASGRDGDSVTAKKPGGQMRGTTRCFLCLGNTKNVKVNWRIIYTVQL